MPLPNGIQAPLEPARENLGSDSERSKPETVVDDDDDDDDGGDTPGFVVVGARGGVIVGVVVVVVVGRGDGVEVRNLSAQKLSTGCSPRGPVRQFLSSMCAMALDISIVLPFGIL